MVKKILKIELIALITLSLICLTYSLFSSVIPDNSLQISSQTESYLSLSYYLSSLFAEVSYYTGPWLLIPTMVYCLIYFTIISKRMRSTDIILGFGLVLASYFFTAMVAPNWLGQGLAFLSQKYVSIYFAFFSFIPLVLLLSFITMRGGFLILLKKLHLKMDNWRLVVLRSFYYMQKKSRDLRIPSASRVKAISFKNKTVDFLKKPNLIKENHDELEEYQQDQSLQTEEVAEDISSEVENLAVSPEPKETVVETKKKRKKQKKFFESKELIDCISQSINHTHSPGPGSGYFQTITQAIESKLGEFKVDGKIINILKGPVVDTFELELGSGVKVSKVTGLSDDIGLALSGAPIRIVYPMRGKSTIGIEVPRNPRDYIFLDEVLKSKAFNDSQQRLPIAMGKDAFGAVKVVDLAGMPHMLVAGATGAGKSVFINTLLVSLIIKKSPQDLKLILIDPKQLELALFSNLPHLMLPVLTQPKNSAVALLWAVEEMERRYTILREMGVKNIEGFNRKIATCDQALLHKISEHYGDHHEGYKLPYIVIVIDEFADLILSKMGKEIETNVNRLAAKARAAGIHLVVATQRPSTDVVTGIIKANFPTRVSFRVSTGHDSKTILDQYGAEKLLGKGDMLYKHGVDLLRLHSSFVEESEIEGVIKKLESLPRSFDEDAVDFLESGGEEYSETANTSGSYTTGSSEDPMYAQALEIVMESGSASASMLQRRLRVGYNRAANLVEELERNGVVGPAQGSKPREVIRSS